MTAKLYRKADALQSASKVSRTLPHLLSRSTTRSPHGEHSPARPLLVRSADARAPKSPYGRRLPAVLVPWPRAYDGAVPEFGLAGG